ncbi:MAG TPA: glycoside hydrolase family 9 protein [Kineosporiaceae bacterium]|nr:glycoside hydrolase family 9 protein [Kineosporiaceae bacterium]
MSSALMRPRSLARRRMTGLLALVVGLTLVTTGSAALAAGPEQITNGDFADGLTGWNNYPAATVTDGQGCIDVPAHAGAYAAAISQKPIPMLLDESYTLTFSASVTPGTSGTVRAVIQAGAEQNYAQAFPENALELGPELKQFTFTFTSGFAIPEAELAFQQSTDNTAAYRLCVDDVSLTGGATPPVYQPDTGPRVRVNQVGYLPRGPKGATLVTELTSATGWQLKNAAGKVVATGRTKPRGVDPSAGLNVHTIDFGSYTKAGTGYTLVADGEISHPFDLSDSVYRALRKDSKTFFYTQRSGLAISDAIAPGYGRAAGHLGVAPNQGDTAVPCQDLADDSQKLLAEPWTCDYTSDVSGGWYDAGDHGKYVVNGGISVAQLMQEYERTLTARTAHPGQLADGTLRVPETGNKVPDLLDEARWELEWMLKMQVRAGRPLAGMAFHKVADVDWTGLPMAPAADPQKRVLYRPSTAATLNLAAAAAQGARLFLPYDRAFAKRLLTASTTAYAAAKANPALFAPAPNGALDPNPGSGPYDDTDVSDEFYWAAAELYLSTGAKTYRQDVLGSAVNTADVFTASGFDWSHLGALARLDLATVPSALPGRAAIRKSVIEAGRQLLADQASQPFAQAYAPSDGNYTWGSNSAILNNMQVLGTAYDLSGDPRLRDGVLRSMDYLLGRNALNLSYVTGYGDVFSQNQHSRMYAHQVDSTLPHPPAGTVAGGPNSTAATTGDPVATPLFKNGCAAQFCYIDHIGSWSTNEITVNWNAPLSWVSSFLADQR